MQDNPRPAKAAVVEEVKERLGSADAAILTEYRGLTVQDLATLRRSLREAGGEYTIYKNTLVRFAVQGSGLAELEPLLEGPVAIAFVSGDAAAVAKALRDFGRTNPHLVIKGGLLGTTILSAADTTALASLPSREVLLARIAGGLAAPLQQFAGLLQALPRNFAYGLKALIDTKPAEPAPEPEPEAPVLVATEDKKAEILADAGMPPAEEPASEEPAVEEPAAEEPVAEAPVEEPAPEPETTESTESASPEEEGEQ
jgi:large subunit ribosomal protein L10